MIPFDFASRFLKKNENKRLFCPYLVDKILDKTHCKDKIKKRKNQNESKGTFANINRSHSSHSEADTRTILHAFSCVQSVIKVIYVQANDTDAVAILVAYMPNFLEINSNELDLTLVAYL